MKRFSRILTAPLRLRTAKGFGVHSPFAFAFILNVLRQRNPYYCYGDQQRRNKAAKNVLGKDSVPSVSRQHLIFRICNRFRPRVIFQIGHSDGLETMALLDASDRIHVVSYYHLEPSSLFRRLTASRSRRIYIAPNFLDAVTNYNELLGADRPFIIVNRAENTDSDREFILNAITREAIVIFTDVTSSETTRELWLDVNDRLESHGMTFTNDRFGIIVGLSHLPRQTFKLWL